MNRRGFLKGLGIVACAPLGMGLKAKPKVYKHKDYNIIINGQKYKCSGISYQTKTPFHNTVLNLRPYQKQMKIQMIKIKVNYKLMKNGKLKRIK